MSEEPHPFFVRINGPDMLRVSLLESSKLMLHSLQSYYKVTMVRKTKKESLNSLKTQVKELILLLNKLESMLPYQDVVAKTVTITQAKKLVETKPKQTRPNAIGEVTETKSTPSFSELDKLNKALATIEEKLNKI